MRYGHLLALILFLTFILALVYVFQSSEGQKIDVGQVRQTTIYTSPQSQRTVADTSGFYTEPSAAKVLYTDSGFSPQIASIAPNTTVVFENRSSSYFWPASDSYPGNGLCGRSLDSCAPVPSGQS